MKTILSLALLAASTVPLAHPGHGKPGLDHDHTPGDLALVLFLVLAVALGAWALLRFFGRKDR
jgi:hypothetical protein